MSIPESQLADWSALANAATPGPWKALRNPEKSIDWVEAMCHAVGVALSKRIAKDANRLLRERLEKAAIIFSHRCGGPDAIWDAWSNEEAHATDTHRARLVAIEEIKKT